MADDHDGRGARCPVTEPVLAPDAVRTLSGVTGRLTAAARHAASRPDDVAPPLAPRLRGLRGLRHG
ncbi:hypothetical protein VT52_000715 [Streptomyces malaysiense]|uniref:Uncharacterized protein n=1 Tax=Streptomyces malaysiense TaxID=1428626 RepID=A0A1J4QAW1_9ACTN|nr:hypothetical protein VT52_000715 [Streptomyces malaysiense]